MPSFTPRVSVLCCAAIIALAGCGGSSNNNSSGGGGGGGGESSTTVTYTFKVAVPAAVATQLGNAAYTAATLQSSKLTLTIPNGITNYSVAFACPAVVLDGFTSNEEFIVQRSTLDGTSFTEACTNPTLAQEGLVSVQVDASAIPGASFVGISMNGYSSPVPWLGSALAVSAPLAVGTSDLFVVVYDSTLQYPLAVRVLRSQAIPGALNGGNPVVFTASDETSKQTIAYNNVPEGTTPPENPQVTFYTSGGQYLQLVTDIMAVKPSQYLAMPASAVQSGDFYTFLASAGSGAAYGSLAVELATSQGGPQTLTFPSTSWSYAGPTPAPLPAFNFNYAGFSGSQNVLDIASIQWTPSAIQANPLPSTFNSIQVSATANYQNGATTLTIPDLSALAGFIQSPPSMTTVDWYAGIAQGNGFQTTPPNGTVQTVDSSGFYKVP